jgi:hypothetical protein
MEPILAVVVFYSLFSLVAFASCLYAKWLERAKRKSEVYGF